MSVRTFDASGMRCPIPVLKASKEIRAMESGDVIEIIATDGQAPKDFCDFCNEGGHELLKNEEQDGKYLIVIQKG